MAHYSRLQDWDCSIARNGLYSLNARDHQLESLASSRPCVCSKMTVQLDGNRRDCVLSEEEDELVRKMGREDRPMHWSLVWIILGERTSQGEVRQLEYVVASHCSALSKGVRRGRKWKKVDGYLERCFAFLGSMKLIWV